MNPNQANDLRAMRKILLLISSLGLMLFMFYWVSTHAYLEISVESSTNDPVSYKLTQNSDTIEYKDSPRAIKKLVRRGAYTILTRQGTKNALQTTKVGGFLTTTRTTATLVDERARVFVGDKPKKCMNMLGQVLISFDCRKGVDTLQLHVPATATSPGYVRGRSRSSENVLQGVAQTKEGLVALIRTAESGEPGTPYVAALIDGSLQFTSSTTLTDLKDSETFSILPYKDGFLTYSNNTREVFYYPSVTAAPTRITLAKPANEKLTPYHLHVSGEAIIVAYTTPDSAPSTEDDDRPSLKQESEVVVQRNEQAKRFTFPRTYAQFRLCSTNKLCILDDEMLEVYDLGKEKPVLSFTQPGIKDIEIARSGLVLVTNEGTFNFDPDKQTGALAYSFGSYKYCGLQPAGESYLLCVTNAKKKNLALYIDPRHPSDSIDQKIAELVKLSEIVDLSVSGKFIHITGNFGKRQYNPANNTYGYNPETRQRVTQKINEELDRLGIDRTIYHISAP